MSFNTKATSTSYCAEPAICLNAAMKLAHKCVSVYFLIKNENQYK